MSHKSKATQKELKARLKGREIRRENREKIKAMSEQERTANNAKLGEVSRNKEFDKLKNPWSSRGKMNTIFN
jgi:hypothetical protein